MKIAGKEFKEILVIKDNEELVISITDENVIEKEGYKAICVPVNDQPTGSKSHEISHECDTTA